MKFFFITKREHVLKMTGDIGLLFRYPDAQTNRTTNIFVTGIAYQLERC